MKNEWLTVKDAADVLGCSERTVWRRVSSGALEIRRDVTPHEVLVECDSDTVLTDSDTVSRLSEELAEERSEVERLSVEVERLEEVLSEVRSERDYLRSALAASLSTSQRLLEHVEEPEEGWFKRLARRVGL